MFTSELISALLFQSGYNAAVVTVGATILGTTAGAAGGFLFLRKRALVSDAMAHATLPGIALAFLLMVALGGDGRSLIGLLIGAAATAALGFILVEQMS
ncbi:MAG: metal ABC transporter permease, partial [Pseudomonadota bacterium]